MNLGLAVTRRWFVVLLVIIALSIGILIGASGPRIRAQNPPEKEVVDQHFKVVANVLPDNLESELKKLNAQGYTINPNNDLILVGDKFTIIISDNEETGDEDGR